MFLRNISIPTKMVVLACGSTAVALVLACVSFAWYGANSLRDAKGRQLRDQAEIIAFQSAPAVAMRDEARATEMLSSLQTDPTIEEARIYGRDRKIVATWGDQRTATAPVYSSRGYRFIGYKHVEVLHPVIVGSQRLGAVYIRANMTDLHARFGDFIRIACYVLAFAMLVVILITMRLQRAISSPIIALTKTAQQISLNADPSIRVEGQAGGELKTLQDAFNRMLDRIQQSEQALQSAHGDLEDRVFERTRELSQEVKRRKQTQDALEAAKEVAEAANQAKTEFLANMSHEIRTPLNGIMGFTDILLTNTEQLSLEERVDYLRTIRTSGSHLCSLINDILDVSKIEAGRFELERISCSPRQILEEVVAVLKVQAEEKGLYLKYETSDDLPETISSDPGRLRQLLMNLIGNAVKFTEVGGIQISADVTASTPQQLRFEVIDTGVGIATEQLEAIFDPFSQADTSVTRRFGGTGLGLAISRKICETLGGRLTVQSELGVGSVFLATINANATGEASSTTDDLKPATQEINSSQSIPLTNRRILVVDDGDTNRKLVQLILRRAGAQVTTAENGLEGMHTVNRENPELILMDMQMPVMDGYSATRQLRAEGLTLPIIALTAHAMKGDEEKCIEAGCSAYLTKPVDAERVVAIVSEWLSKTESPAPMIDDEEPAEPPVAPEIHSTLPLDDAEFCEIVIEFVDRLRDKLIEMRRVHSLAGWSQLTSLAHWLKGAGGTAGFQDLTEPSRELEQAAKDSDAAACNMWLSTLEEIASRIVPPKVPSEV